MRSEIQSRIDSLPWDALTADLDQYAYAVTAPSLSSAECGDLIQMYGDDAIFRSRVVMARHNFGRGEYKYFSAPLPSLIDGLRHAFYPHLAAIANQWMERMGDETRFPPTLDVFLERCHAVNQTRPTPLLLRYEAGDYNCLHQDLYGKIAFPLQVACVLSRQNEDFSGGEFLLAEQRPRMQTRGEAVAPPQGAFLIFPNRYRPVRGTRGDYRVNLRHGVSRLRSGTRYCLGLIFHDAA